jgi:hypothetical protein
MFVTGSIFGLVSVGIVLGLIKIKALKSTLAKVKDKLMWSSVFRSQIQTYFPTCILVFSSLHYKDVDWIEFIQILVVISLPFFFWWFISSNMSQLGHA